MEINHLEYRNITDTSKGSQYFLCLSSAHRIVALMLVDAIAICEKTPKSQLYDSVNVNTNVGHVKMEGGD